MAQDSHQPKATARMCRLLRQFLALACLVSSGAAAPPSGGISPVQTVGHSQGFTGSYPTSVIQGLEGRLWVSTINGDLFVGDGLRFLRVDLPQA